MAKISLALPDNSCLEVESGTTAQEVAEMIGAGLARDAVAARVDGQLVDLSSSIQQDAHFAVVTFDDPEGREVYRHSAAHIMADAVMRLFTQAKPTIGPAIADGFYYDFDVPEPFTDEDLAQIESEMEKIIAADLPFTRQVVSPDEARELSRDNPYKLEMIDGLQQTGEEEITLYKHGEFVDLCRGPHLSSPGRIGAVKRLVSAQPPSSPSRSRRGDPGPGDSRESRGSLHSPSSRNRRFPRVSSCRNRCG